MAKAAPIFPLTLTRKPLAASAQVLLVRWNEVVAWSSVVHDPQNVQDLHDMRIAAKRLRYTLEIFALALPNVDPILRTIEQLQERIGKIHDCDVLFPLLYTTLEAEMKREKRILALRGVGPPPYLAAEGLAALISSKRSERKNLYEDFITWWMAIPPARLGVSIEELVHSASENEQNGTKFAAANDDSND